MHSWFQADAIITPSDWLRWDGMLGLWLSALSQNWHIAFIAVTATMSEMVEYEYSTCILITIHVLDICSGWHINLGITLGPFKRVSMTITLKDQWYREHHIIITSYSSSAVTIASSLWAEWLALPILFLDTSIISLKVSVSYLRTSTNLYLAPVTVIRLYHHIPSFPMSTCSNLSL